MTIASDSWTGVAHTSSLKISTSMSPVYPASLISVVIAVGAWALLRDSFNAAMDAVPRSIDHVAVRDFLATQAGVETVHHLHIWALGAGEVAMTTHLVRPPTDDHDAFIDMLTHALDERFGINHPTIQIEHASGCEHDLHDRAPHAH